MQSLFKRIGLSSKETETFLCLLELGAQPVSVIARHVGVPRTSMYSIIEALRKAQLVDVFEKRAIQYVRPIPARSIPDVISHRERELAHIRTMFQEQLPALEAMENTLAIVPKVKFYEGKEEVMRMYSLIMKESAFCSFVDLASVRRSIPEYYHEIPRMIKSSGGSARELLIQSKDAKGYQAEYASSRHQIKFLPKTMRFTSDIIICSDHIFMTAFDRERVASLQVFSKPLAETHLSIFEALWSR